MARLTTELVVRLLDGVTKPAQAAARALNGINAARDNVNRRLDSVRGSMIDAVGVGYALKQAITAPISAAIEFESQMADVRKVVDFPTPKAFEDLKSTLIDMSKRIPVAVDGLAEITAAAGQAGIAGDELLPFVEGAAKVGTAFDISAKEAGDALAKMRAGLGITNAEVFSLADAMNHLSNAQASSASEILDVVRSVGAQAKQFGFNATQVSAFASAMISAGAQSDVAATSFRNMGLALTKGGNATTAQREAFGALGLDSIKVAKRMQKDAVGTTLDVMKRLARLPAYMQAQVSSALFGNEARALGPLLTNLPLLEQSLNLVGNAANYAGSTQKEFEARAATTANGIQIFQNRIRALSINIGAALLPALNDVMAALSPIVDGIADFARENPRLTASIVGLTAGLVGLRIAAIGAQFSLLWMRGGLLTAASAGMGAVSSAMASMSAGLTALRNPSRAAALASVAQAKALVEQRQAAFQSALAMQNLARSGGLAGANLAQATANLKAAGQASVQAQQGLLAANTALAATSRGAALATGAMRVLRLAVIGTGIGAALVGIAAAGAWIYNNWTGISTAFEAFKGAFSRAIEPIRPMLEPVVGLFTAVGDAISTLTGRVDPLGGKWAALGIKIGEGLGGALVKVVEAGRSTVDFLTNMPARLASIQWGDVTAGLIAQFVAIPLRLVQVPLEILNLFTGIDLTGAAATMIATFVETVKTKLGEMAGWVKNKLKDMFTFNVSMPSWLGGAGAAASNSAAAEAGIDAQRAKGGPVSPGKNYLVGETQPEIFTPGASGFITPMDKAATGKTARPGGAGGMTYAPVYHISNVQGVGDLEAVLARHDREAMRQFESYSGGSFSDNG